MEATNLDQYFKQLKMSHSPEELANILDPEILQFLEKILAQQKNSKKKDNSNHRYSPQTDRDSPDEDLDKELLDRNLSQNSHSVAINGSINSYFINKEEHQYDNQIQSLNLTLSNSLKAEEIQSALLEILKDVNRNWESDSKNELATALALFMARIIAVYQNLDTETSNPSENKN